MGLLLSIIQGGVATRFVSIDLSIFFSLDLNVGGPSYPICFFFKDNSIWEDSKQKKRRGLTSSGGWWAITILVSGYGWRSRGNAVCC